MLFGDFGVKTLNEGLIAHRNFIEQNPDVIRRFLRATGRAIKEIAKPQNFDEATDIAIRYTKAAVERRELCNTAVDRDVKIYQFQGDV